MTNPGRQIRAAIVALLKTPYGDPAELPTDAGLRVFDSEDSPGDVDTGKEINVYSPGEVIDAAYQHVGGVRRRIMDLRIECYHYGGSGGSAVDDMRWQVEQTVRRDPTIGNRVEWCKMRESSTFFAAQSDVSIWCAVTSWDVIYYTDIGTDEGNRPTIVLLGFAPDVGPGNEEDYTEIYEAIT